MYQFMLFDRMRESDREILERELILFHSKKLVTKEVYIDL